MPSIHYRDPGTGDFVAIDMGGTPIGAIASFVGSVAPAGWHLCDGSVHGSAALEALIGPNTPNLQDRFLVGVGPSYAKGATGGAETVALTAAMSGAAGHSHAAPSSGTVSVWHTHTLTTNTTGSHTHGEHYQHLAMRNTDLSNTAGGDLTVSSTVTTPSYNLGAGSHTHTATIAHTTTAHAHSVSVANSAAVAPALAHENMPPFYALAFIIYTG